MVEECVHLFPDGRKCRRIPKRGQKLCPAHRSQPHRRAPLEEKEAFYKEMVAFIAHLEAMETADLLYATTGFLADIHALVDRCSSRRHRIAFHRATASVGIAVDRLTELARGLHQGPSARPMPPPQPFVPATSRPLSPEARARLERAEAILDSDRDLTDQELRDLCDQMTSILESNVGTTSTLHSNT